MYKREKCNEKKLNLYAFLDMSPSIIKPDKTRLRIGCIQWQWAENILNNEYE